MDTADIADIIPLSPVQQGILFHSKYAPDSGVYFEHWICTLHGKLDVPALHAAFQRAMDRHSILRTAFFWETLDEPLQVVYRNVRFPLELRDWRALPAAQQQAMLEEFIEADRVRGFNLSQAPLIRLTLIRLADEVHQCVWSVHHLLMDGWSVSPLLGEVFASYEAFQRGLEPHLEPSRPYADYIGWLATRDLAQAEAFWREQMKGFTRPTPLEMGRTRPAKGLEGALFAELQLRLPAETASALQAFARTHHLTLGTLLQGAWALLLAHFSGEDDLVFGVTMSGRPAALAGVERIVGCFLNTLPMRARLRRDETVLAFLKRLREQQVRLSEYEFSPLLQIHGWSEVPRAHPLFESLVVLENFPWTFALEDPNRSIAIRDLRIVEQTHYPLTFAIVPPGRLGPELTLLLSYDRRRFEDSTIQRLLVQVRELLEGFLAAPERQLGNIQTLSVEERRRVLVEWNTTQTDYPRDTCVHVAMAEWAAKAPEALAVAHGTDRLSYGELDRKANQLACHLRRRGVRPGDVVATCMEPCVERVVVLLGILKTGAAYLPLDPASPRERLAFMLEDSRARELVTQSSLAEAFGDACATALLVDRDRESLGREDPTPPAVPTSGEALAYVIYTSGSTGRPKGVAIRHQSLANLVAWHRRAYDVTPRDRGSLIAGAAFDASVWELWPYLASGASVHIPSQETRGSPPGLVRWLASEQISLCFLPTPLAEAVLDEPWPEALALKALLTGGDRLRRRPRAGLRTQVVNHYGPTEATVLATCAPVAPSAPGDALPPIGRPIANTRVYLLDRELRPVPMGAPGELCIAGDGLAVGYLHRPELTAERFVPDPFATHSAGRLYRTGDLARYLPDGNLEYIGRTDEQVKIRGVRIEPGEIEAVLTRHPMVREALVIAREEVSGNNRLVAYVVAKESTLDLSSLRDTLKRQLPGAMLPSAFVTLDALPLTPNGKVDRQALPAPDGHASSAGEYVAPRTSTERQLADIWAEVLKLERVGATDDFFSLGGHSLLAAQVVTRVLTAFGVDLPLRAIFESPTLEGLARALDAAVQGSRGADVPPLVPVPRTAELPLSFSQQRLWFLAQMDPGNPVYNIPGAVRFLGELDVPALERSFQELMRRHEALRTHFRSEDGQPRQVISPPGPVHLESVDLRALPPDQRGAELQRRLAVEADRPFDLANDVLLRANLFVLDEQEHVLALTVHHIVSDGWSMGVLIEELSALYSAFSANKPSLLPDLPVQYADYAVWQRQWVSGALLEKQLEWWQRQLADVPPSLELPTDFPRPNVQRFLGAAVTSTLPGPLSAAVRTLAAREGATPFMVLLAVFQVLLSRYSGQEDLCVGVPIAGRRHVGLERLIGFFVNTLVLRTRLSGDPSFRELLARVRETTLDTFAHQDLPFERLVEELAPVRHHNRTPLVQVAFVLQNAPAGTLPGTPRLRVEPFPVATRSAKFDLTLSLAETPDGFQARLEYDADLFREDTARRMMEHLQVLLQGATDHPDQHLSRLPLLSEAERRRVLVEWNDTTTDYPRDASVPALFAAQAAQTPDAIALERGDQFLTYAGLLEQAHRLAHYLVALGVRPGDRVAICLGRSFDMVAALLAILEAGATYVPLEPSYPGERLALMLEEASCPLVLTHERLLPVIPPGPRAVSLDTLGPVLAGMPTTALAPSGSADAPAYIMFTSGSTGRPKGVCVPHRGIVRLVKGARYADFGPDTVFAQLAPIAFDASTFELWGALLNGGRLVLFPDGALSLAELAALVKQHGVNTLWLTSALFEQMAAAYPEVLASIRQVLAGGDVLSPARVQHLLGLGARIINGYGPTEGTTFTACYQMSSPEDVGATVSIGRPISNTRVYLLDVQLEPVPPGVTGELYIAGDGLASGYLNQPGLTAERFLPDPFSPEPGGRMYRSGDLARFLPDGRIEFLGRRDAQVKIRGFRVEPGEVEAVLARHEAVREAVVVAREGPGGKQLVAYVVAAGTVEPSSLKEHLARQLPPYMVPSAFVRMEALPLTPSGKVDRKALPAPDSRASSSAGEYVAPRTSTELQLADIWAEVLKLEHVGVAENFFSLGAHSLLAIQVVSRIRATFGVNLPLRTLFEFPTIEALARALEQLGVGANTDVSRIGHTQEEAPPWLVLERPTVLARMTGPTSMAQSRWLGYAGSNPHRPKSTGNVPMAMRITGRLDVAALERALNKIMERHEVLRTHFARGDEGFAFKVSQPAPVQLEQLDFLGFPQEQREQEMLHRVYQDASQPFDLLAPPMFRAWLYVLGPEEQVLLLATHHIAWDGWSEAILFHELSLAYTAYTRGEQPHLPDMLIQYSDFAWWQHEQMRGEYLESLRSYWRKQLADGVSMVDFPLDKPRPATRTYNTLSATAHFSEELSAAIKALCQREGATLYMLAMATYQALLALRSGARDITVFSNIGGRDQVEVENLIGCFTNIVLIRTSLEGDPSFRDLLARVREGVLGALAHSALPYQQVLEMIAQYPDSKSARTFPGLNLQNFQKIGASKLTVEGLQFDRLNIPLGSGGIMVNMFFFISEEEDNRISVTAQANGDIYEARTVERIVEDYQRLMEVVCVDPNRQFSALLSPVAST